MAHTTLVAALLLAVSFLVFQVLDLGIQARRRAAKARELGCREPPSEPTRLPFGVDIIKAAVQADNTQSFPQWLMGRYQAMRADTWKFTVLGQTTVMTVDPRNIQAVLAHNFGTFDLGPRRASVLWPMLGNGIFTQSGSEWKRSRELMRPQFTRDQVGDLDLEERHVQNLMRALDGQMLPDGWTDLVDLQDFFFRLTLDSATEFLLGESAGSQLQHVPGHREQRPDDADDIHKIDFAFHFDRSQNAVSSRLHRGPLWWLYNPRWFRESTRQCNRFMDHYVRLALDKGLGDKQAQGLEGRPAGAGVGKARYVFLDALAAQTQDPAELRSQLMHVLLAGRDTTASALGWLFHCLARDPARLKKLRGAVVAEFGTCGRPGAAITFARLKGCQYLQHCISEALRLYPVVPLNSRWCYRDTALPTGGGPDGSEPVFVPGGSAVDYSVYVMHRRQDLWGPDADAFRPERWAGRRPGWEYLPFNGGPRICLGQQFALAEASYVTVRMLQRFDAVENLDSDPVVKHNLTLTDCSGNGVKVRLHAAAE